MGVSVSQCVQGEWYIRLTPACHLLTTIRKLFWQTVRLKATVANTHMYKQRSHVYRLAEEWRMSRRSFQTITTYVGMGTHTHTHAHRKADTVMHGHHYPHPSLDSCSLCRAHWNCTPLHVYTHKKISLPIRQYKSNTLITGEVKSRLTSVVKLCMKASKICSENQPYLPEENAFSFAFILPIFI